MKQPIRSISAFICVLLSLIMVVPCYAHPGGTDGLGGHHVADTGEYHYHHGYSAHDHTDIDGDGVEDCPYEFDDRTGESSDSPTPSRTAPEPSSNSSSSNSNSDLILCILCLSAGVLVLYWRIRSIIHRLADRRRLRAAQQEAPRKPNAQLLAAAQTICPEHLSRLNTLYYQLDSLNLPKAKRARTCSILATIASCCFAVAVFVEFYYLVVPMVFALSISGAALAVTALSYRQELLSAKQLHADIRLQTSIILRKINPISKPNSK